MIFLMLAPRLIKSEAETAGEKEARLSREDVLKAAVSNGKIVSRDEWASQSRGVASIMILEFKNGEGLNEITSLVNSLQNLGFCEIHYNEKEEAVESVNLQVENLSALYSIDRKVRRRLKDLDDRISNGEVSEYFRKGEYGEYKIYLVKEEANWVLVFVATK
jgi:hypothetical protein